MSAFGVVCAGGQEIARSRPPPPPRQTSGKLVSEPSTHAISFVHDEVRHALEVGLARLEHVDEASGRSDADFDARLQVLDLLKLGNSTKDAAVLQR